MNNDVDILMITYNRPAYTALSIRRLLDTCTENARVWLWHNGNDEETLSVVKSFLEHPNVFRFHHSEDNKKLTEPTNWLWQNAKGTYVSKVDDDCLVPQGWIETLVQAHTDVPELGVVACWHFQQEDYEPELAAKKIRRFGESHAVLLNCWVNGSGYVMKKTCVDQQGLLSNQRTFTDYCIRLAARGWLNGWYFPFLYQEHMDDPRAEHTLLKSDEDLTANLPLSAFRNGRIATLADWQAQLRQSARTVQEAPFNPKQYIGWRARVRRAASKLLTGSW